MGKCIRTGRGKEETDTSSQCKGELQRDCKISDDYIKKVDAAKKRGKEYCDLVSSEPYPMRQEHIDYFLKKGYDIYWSVLDLETGPAYYYKAVWTEDAEGKLKEGF